MLHVFLQKRISLERESVSSLPQDQLSRVEKEKGDLAQQLEDLDAAKRKLANLKEDIKTLSAASDVRIDQVCSLLVYCFDSVYIHTVYMYMYSL